MNQENLAQLVTDAQSGDAGALEQLLLWAYTPVAFVCRKLLRDSRVAQNQILEILRRISQEMDTLPLPSEFETWVMTMTAEECVRAQQERPWMDGTDGEETELPIIGETLDEQQTVDAVQTMVDMLPGKPRTCMTLRCCCGMKSDDIAELTGYDAEDVRESMGAAQSFVLEQLQKYQDLGTQFYPITSLADILRSAMGNENAQEAATAVSFILGKAETGTEESGKGKRIVLWILIVLMILLNLVLVILNVIAKNQNTYAPMETAYYALSSESIAEV